MSVAEGESAATPRNTALLAIASFILRFAFVAQLPRRWFRGAAVVVGRGVIRAVAAPMPRVIAPAFAVLRHSPITSFRGKNRRTTTVERLTVVTPNERRCGDGVGQVISEGAAGRFRRGSPAGKNGGPATEADLVRVDRRQTATGDASCECGCSRRRRRSDSGFLPHRTRGSAPPTPCPSCS
jgi:hypothetical protein